jgi:hypothetical protein
VVSLNIRKELLPPKEPIEVLEGEALVEAVKEWFLSNFEDPVHETPYNGQEGGYQYIWGGPFDAREQIEGYFGSSVPEEIIEQVVSALEEEASDWAPRRISGSQNAACVLGVKPNLVGSLPLRNGRGWPRGSLSSYNCGNRQNTWV